MKTSGGLCTDRVIIDGAVIIIASLADLGGGNPAMPSSSHMQWPIRPHSSLKQHDENIEKKTRNIEA